MHKSPEPSGLASPATLVAALIAAVLFSGLWALPVAARVQQAPSSRVQIDLPEGYEPARLFSGFVNDRLGVSFVIVEMPGQAYDELVKGLTPAALSARGVTVRRQGKLGRPDEHIYIEGQQVSAAGTFAKYLVAFRDGDVTALITANVQKPANGEREAMAQEIEAALASARIVATPAEARELFTLGYLGPFRLAGGFLGNAKAYTLDGRPPQTLPGRGQPMVIVAPSLDQRAVGAPESYAETLLQGLDSGLSGIKVLERRPVTYNGLGGIEIEAKAQERDTGATVLLFQVVLLPRDGGYWRILAQAPMSERDRFLPEFRRIAASFAVRP